MPICISGGVVAAARNRHKDNEQNPKEPFNKYYVAFHIYVLKRVNIIKKDYLGQIASYNPDTNEYTLTDDYSQKKLFWREDNPDPWTVRDKLEEQYGGELIFKLTSCEVREYHWFDENGDEHVTLYHSVD